MSSVQTQYSPVSPDRRYFIRTARPETMRTAPDYVTATLLPALVRAGYLFNLLSNQWFGSRTPTRENRSTIPSPRSAAPIPMRLNPLCWVNRRVEPRRRPPSIGQPARVQKNPTAATTPEPAKLLTTSDTRPGIFTVASSRERLETDSPDGPLTGISDRFLISCQSLNPVLRNNSPFRIPNLHPNLYDRAFSTDRFRLGLRRHRTPVRTRPLIESPDLQPTPQTLIVVPRSPPPRVNSRCNLAGTLSRQNCQL